VVGIEKPGPDSIWVRVPLGEPLSNLRKESEDLIEPKEEEREDLRDEEGDKDDKFFPCCVLI
jgi:hypothetical protein